MRGKTESCIRTVGEKKKKKKNLKKKWMKMTKLIMNEISTKVKVVVKEILLCINNR